MKIVINKCYGNFDLSDEAVKWLKFHGDCTDPYGLKRNDPRLIECVELLGEQANRDYSKLKIVEIPDDVKWEICEHDGREWVSEQHKRWS